MVMFDAALIIFVIICNRRLIWFKFIDCNKNIATSIRKNSISLQLYFNLLRANKILKLRLFEEAGKRWKKSVMDMNYEVLCISQVIPTRFLTWVH